MLEIVLLFILFHITKWKLGREKKAVKDKIALFICSLLNQAVLYVSYIKSA